MFFFDSIPIIYQHLILKGCNDIQIRNLNLVLLDEIIPGNTNKRHGDWGTKLYLYKERARHVKQTVDKRSLDRKGELQ